MKLEGPGVKIKGVRETRNREVLIEVGSMPEEETKLSSATAAAVRKCGVVCHLVPKTEDEILYINMTTQPEELC